MIPESMRAAYITEHGGPEAIRTGKLPVPAPGPGEVLVRAEAFGVNHVDALIRSGAYATPTPFPFIIGRDVVGTVAAVGPRAGGPGAGQPGAGGPSARRPSADGPGAGQPSADGPGADGFTVGERVWSNSLGHHGRQGSFSEYVLVLAERLYPLPDGVDPRHAASVLHTAATAHLGLFREGGLTTSSTGTAGGARATVVIGGAGGGVGSAAVQLASAAGARVIATASAEDDGWCRSCGASEVIDYRDPHWSARVAEAAPHGVNLFWDTSGHHDFEATIPLLAQGARMILAASMDAVPPLPVGQVYTRDASLRGFAISNASPGDLAIAAQAINNQLAEGRLRTRIGVELPLERAADAHRLLQSTDPAAPKGRIIVY